MGVKNAREPKGQRCLMASELGLTSPNYAEGCPENFTVISFWLELIDFQYLFMGGGGGGNGFY